MLGLVLLVGVFGGAAVPPVDLPETVFDESDTPVNLAPPSQGTLQFVPPVGDPLVTPRSQFLAGYVIGRVLVHTAISTERHPHSLQDLLCTFLI
jgi:hypothetical protein